MKVKKKSVEGLNTRLKEIEGAGFIENKKEKNVNRRAGLRDKRADADGGRVKRRKPLALKHVRRGKRVAVTALSCLCLGAVGAVGVGFFTNKDHSTTDKLFSTVCYETPADGSLPTAHTLLENVGYLNYTLQKQAHWSSAMTSSVNAAGFKQAIQNYKQYYDGVLISVDIAEGFSQKANQFCVVKEEGVVLWRPSATKKFDGLNTKWSDGAAEGCTIDEFRERRGFPPSEFSVYVLNENTILNAQDYTVTDNGDGTYSMTLELSVNVGEDERAADYYYRQQMMVTGDLSSKPVITKTSVTYVFDASWQVLSLYISDEYTALGGVRCSSQSLTKFDYSKEKAENTYYTDYFKQYEKNFVKNDAPAVSEPKPLDFITAAFAPVLQGGAALDIDLAFDDLRLDGAAYIELNDGALGDVRIALGDIKIFIGGGNVLYVTDGSAKYKLDIGGLLAAAPAAEEAGGTAAGLDAAALIDQLASGEFTVTEDAARLKSVLSLFGLDISLDFDFEIGEGGKINLGSIAAEIPFNGKTLKARAEYGGEEDIPAKPQSFDGYKDILNEGISLDISLSAGELKLDGFASVIMEEGSLGGVRAELGEISVYYDCPANMLYLSDGGAKYYLDLTKAFKGGADLSAILGAIDVNGLLSQVLNNLSAGGGKISTKATLEILEQTVCAGLGLRLTGGIALDLSAQVSGHEVKAVAGLSDRAAEKPSTDGYSDILNGVAFDAKIAVDGFVLEGKATVKLGDGKLESFIAEFGKLNIYAAQNALYIEADSLKYKIALPAGGEKFSLGTDGILQKITGNLGFTQTGVSANAALDILNNTVKAAAEVNLFGGLSVGAEIELAGKKITLLAGLSDELQTLPDLNGYADILNDGVQFGVTLGLDEFTLAGVAKIDVEGGAFRGFGFISDELSVYYVKETNAVYFTDGTAEYKVCLPQSKATSLPQIPELLGDLIKNLCFKEGKISTGVTLPDVFGGELTATLGIALDGGLKADASATLFGKKISIELTASCDDAAINYGELETYTDILNGGVTLDVSLAVGGVNLSGVVFAGLKDGNFTALQADFGEIKVYYSAQQNELYLAVGTTKLFVPLTDSEQGRADFGSAFDNLDVSVGDLLRNLTTALKSISLSQGVTVFDSTVFANVTLDVADGISVSADVTLLGIPVSANIAFASAAPAEIDKEEYINVFENYFGLADSLIGDNFSAGVNGSIYDVSGGVESVKYEFSAAIEYDNGATVGENGEKVEKGFPVSFDKATVDGDGVRTPMNLRVDDELYLHFNLALKPADANADGLYIDLYVLDANPAEGEKGFTAGGYTEDNELDVYVCVSKYLSDDPRYSPLKIYAPVREILTLVSVAGAALDLENIKFENSEELTKAVSEIATVIDELLIDKYLPATKDQFASLGESLIPQILGKSLGEFLNELLAPVISGVPAGVSGDGAELDLNARYVNNISYGEEGFNLELNSALLYGAEGLENTSAEVLTKDIGGVKFLSDIRVNNVYTGGNAQKMDLAASFKYGETVRPAKDSAFANYRNFDGADTLVKALVNSVTHSKENATDKEIEISGLENLPDYILNHYFYIEGHLQVDLKIVFDSIKPTIELDIVAISVTVDEETNEVAVNVRLHYKELMVEALGSKFKCIKGESFVDLTIKNGMLFIKREQVNYLQDGDSGLAGWLVETMGYELTPTNGKTSPCDIVTYRAYELKSMSGDIANILDLVGYIFNFDERLVKIINDNVAGQDTGNNKEPVDYSGLDYGALVSKYLDYFVYGDDGAGNASWQASISGGFITDMLGMQTSSPVITFNASYENDGNGAKVYTVQGLEIAPVTIKFLDAVDISLTASGSFGYCNPQLIMKDGLQDVTCSAAPLWEEVFGCGSSEIATTALWERALAKSGTNYLSVTPDGAVRLGELKFTLEGNGFADGGKVLYSADGVLSEAIYPSWTVKNGYTAATSFDPATVTVNAVYAPNVYEVAVTANGALVENAEYVYGTDLDLSERIGKTVTCGDGNNYKIKSFTVDGVDYGGLIPASALADIWRKDIDIAAALEIIEDDNAVHVTLKSGVPFVYGGVNYESFANVDFEGGYALADATADGYSFHGWWYSDGANWSKLSSVDSFTAGSAVTVEALWLKVSLNGSGSKSGIVGKRTYNINYDFTVGLIGNSEIVGAVRFENYSLSGFVNQDANINGTGYKVGTKAEALVLNNRYSGTISGKQDNKSNWNIRLDIRFVYRNPSGATVYDSGNVTTHIYGKL